MTKIALKAENWLKYSVDEYDARIKIEFWVLTQETFMCP